MSENEKGNPRPDGFSASIPIPRTPFGIGGTYYWNPGSPTAPHVTLTGGIGKGGGGAHFVFLRKGMTSEDTLGYGGTANIAPTVFPSATVNASIPDDHFIPQLSKAKISSIEAGASMPGFAATYTATPQQIADLIFSPAGGPGDEFSPFIKSLQSSHGTVGQPSERPVRFLGRHDGNALGNGMAGWTGNLPDRNMISTAAGSNGPNDNTSGTNVSPSQASPFTTGAPSVPFLPPATPGKFGGLLGLMAEIGAIDPLNPDQPPPAGLAGLFAEYMRNNAPGRD